GIAGRFVRRDLLAFAAADAAEANDIHFQRLDTGDAVSVEFDAGKVPPSEAQRALMGVVLQGQASQQQLADFASSWQERVRRILLQHADQVITVRPLQETVPA